jgi:type IV secretory pathway TrbL component
MVAQNLVFTLKAHAGATRIKKDATSLTKQAEAVVTANQKCFKGGSSGGGGGSSGNAASTSQSPSETQQQQLEQKEQAGRERQAQFAREEQYNPNDPSIKPW